MSKIESKFFIIKKQNVNQSIKVETYAIVIKVITKITKNENEKENIVKKTIKSARIEVREYVIDCLIALSKMKTSYLYKQLRCSET